MGSTRLGGQSEPKPNPLPNFDPRRAGGSVPARTVGEKQNFIFCNRVPASIRAFPQGTRTSPHRFALAKNAGRIFLQSTTVVACCELSALLVPAHKRRRTSHTRAFLEPLESLRVDHRQYLQCAALILALWRAAATGRIERKTGFSFSTSSNLHGGWLRGANLGNDRRAVMFVVKLKRR